MATPTISISWGKAGDNKWQKLGGPCDVCGPDGCDHTHAPTGLEQSLEEMEFTRSACNHALNGEADKLRNCIERNAGCVYHDGAGGSSGYTPLHYAARGGHAACVTLLLQARASVLARTQGGATPLMRAAFAGHADVCTLLLRAGSAAEAQDADGETAAHKAAAQRQDATLAVLLKAAPGAAELRNRHSKTPSELRAERG